MKKNTAQKAEKSFSDVLTIQKFCKEQSIEEWQDLSLIAKEILLKVANFCKQNHEGDQRLAKIILTLSQKDVEAISMSLVGNRETESAVALAASLEEEPPPSAKNKLDFKSRLKQAKICVIGAGYADLGHGTNDESRWGAIDPNYMAICGHFELFGNIKGNPIKWDNWNVVGGFLLPRVFLKDFELKSFDCLYFDRGVVLSHMGLWVFGNLLRLLHTWTNLKNKKFGDFSIKSVMIPKQAMQGGRKSGMYAGVASSYLVLVGEEEAAGVQFIRYKFKEADN
jgi:hypothetical protein